MDKVSRFYHVTTAATKASILSTRSLVPQVHNPPEEFMCMLEWQYKNTIPKGIWFCSTLFGWELPTISPYGKQRVTIPVSSIIHQLGGIGHLYRGMDSIVKSNRYVRVMLAKEGDDFECLKHMERLDPFNNEWLKFISDSECEVAKRPTWVQIYCPYEINIDDGEWDELE